MLRRVGPLTGCWVGSGTRSLQAIVEAMPCEAAESAVVGPDAAVVHAFAALEVSADFCEHPVEVDAVVEASSSAFAATSFRAASRMCHQVTLGLGAGTRLDLFLRERAQADRGGRCWRRGQGEGQGFWRVVLLVVGDCFVPPPLEVMRPVVHAVETRRSERFCNRADTSADNVGELVRWMIAP